MKRLYIDCGMGAAGDMLCAALMELFENKEETVKKLNELHIPHVTYVAEDCKKCGIVGTHLSVKVDGMEEGEETHHHHDLQDIRHIVNDHINASPEVKKHILEVYDALAKAESEVHGAPVEQIHFHEVGAADAVADIAGVAYLLDQLNVDEITASPVHVGKGSVACAHGILPVPAPATARLLQGIPCYSGEVEGELCTPTGAALLQHYAHNFDSQPLMRIERIGYGMGKKDFERANCVRMLLGTSKDQKEEIVELSFNVDDMTGEDLGYAFTKLMEAGARDVFTTAISMKKNRPGILVNVVCTQRKKEELLHAIFAHTTTIGVREAIKNRYTMDRTIHSVETEFGEVRIKHSVGYGVEKEKIEFEDLAAIAEKTGLSIREIRNRIMKEKE